MIIKNLSLALLLFIAAAVMQSCFNTKKIKADPPLDASAIKNMIDSQSFVFVPRYVVPWNGRRRDLSGGFDISVSKDTVKSYLPFWGRGYIAPISPTEIDFDFTSVKFSYTTKPMRNGWNISIKPHDQTYLRELYFTVYDNASASLNVTSVDRTAVSYDGYITKRKANSNNK